MRPRNCLQAPRLPLGVGHCEQVMQEVRRHSWVVDVSSFGSQSCSRDMTAARSWQQACCLTLPRLQQTTVAQIWADSRHFDGFCITSVKGM